MSHPIMGFAFPFRFDSSGRVAAASGVDKLKDNIIHILLTGLGERVMRRTYGGGVRQLVHDPNNDALRAIAQHQIAKAITQWEPRVQLQSVTVNQPMDQGEGILIAELTYMVRQTRQVESLSVPIGLGGL